MAKRNRFGIPASQGRGRPSRDSRRIFLALALSLAAASTAALAEDEAQPWVEVENAEHGFSLFYPPNWEPKTIVGDAAVYRFAGDGAGCSVLAARLAPSAGAVTDQENLPRLTAAFAPELLHPDPTIKFLSFGQHELQELRGLRVVFDRPSPQLPGLVLREKFVAVARGEVGFAVRCSAEPKRFGELEGVLDGVIASMRWKEPTDGAAASAVPERSSGTLTRPLAPSYFPMVVAGWFATYLVCAPSLAWLAKRKNRNPRAWGLLGGLLGPMSFAPLLAKPHLLPAGFEITEEGELVDARVSPAGGVPPESRTLASWSLPEPEPVGIGGWLVLPLVGLITTLVASVRSLVADLLPVLQPESWNHLTAVEGDGYSNLWAPYLLGSGLFTVMQMAGAIALLVLFVRRKKSLPLLVSIFYGFVVFTAAFEGLGVQALAHEVPDLFAASDIRRTYLELLRAVVAAAIWITYFRVSRRVKNTFVEP